MWTALFWYLAGAFTVLAGLAALFPWLRTQAQWDRLLASPRRAITIALVPLVAIAILYALLMRPDPMTPVAQTGSLGAAPGAAAPPGSFAAAAKLFASASGDAPPNGTASMGSNPVDGGAKANAGSMEMAVANLEERLAKGGGSDGDWELLAKSFEFLGRPADAAKARAHQLPPSTAGEGVVSGEVMLATSLIGKVAPGETLFIVAKSVDSPGIPVAVLRSSVGDWPLKFTLDDSQSMMPGRSLSRAGRVTIEARISRTGQPLPGPGDLQGTSGVIDPADHKALKIVIDHTIS
jgi:cytochrome c-type biogenesis protein CcmH